MKNEGNVTYRLIHVRAQFSTGFLCRLLRMRELVSCFFYVDWIGKTISYCSTYRRTQGVYSKRK